MTTTEPFIDFFERKLLIITGKGGTGKTTVAAALGLVAQAQGKRTLIVQIETAGGVGSRLGLAPVGYEPIEVAPRLALINIEAKKAFREYVLLQIRYPRLYDAVFGNRLVAAFIGGVPGLGELMCMGKIYVMTREFDFVIVDAPATGHGVSLLQIPSIVASAVRIGPLRVHSEAMESMLKDRRHTSVVITTLPEEMPMEETFELVELLENRLEIGVGGVVINRVLRPLSKGGGGLRQGGSIGEDWRRVEALARIHEARVEGQQGFIRLLRQRLPDIPMSELPYIYEERLTHEILKSMGDRLMTLGVPP